MKGVWQRVRAAQGGETESQPPRAEDACGIRPPPGRGLLGGTGELLRGANAPVLWDHVGWGGRRVREPAGGAQGRAPAPGPREGMVRAAVGLVPQTCCPGTRGWGHRAVPTDVLY